jgi:hypothetical protein
MSNFLKYYDLEHYLFCEVGSKFRQSGNLDYVDLFQIFHWKSVRAKTKIRNKIAGGETFKHAAAGIAKAIWAAQAPKEKLFALMDRGFRLPMASAVLTVLYPDEFTVYDQRVCKIVLDRSSHDYSVASDQCWEEYQNTKKLS